MNLIAYLYRTRVSGPPRVSKKLGSAGGNEHKQAERRSTLRFPLTLPVEVFLDRVAKSQPVKGRTRDVSANGMYFVCNKPYRAGQLLFIKMNLAGEKVGGGDSISLTVGCQVQRVEEIVQGAAKLFGIAVALQD
jgi:hypothetical protein